MSCICVCVPVAVAEEEEGGAFLFDDTASVMLLSVALAVIQYMKKSQRIRLREIHIARYSKKREPLYFNKK
jgi:hypothetical protein